MKSIKEKAKAYDEAIKRLEDIKTGKCQKTFVFTEGLFDYIFPELKESEDEKIRKELLDYCKNRAEIYPNDPKYKNISAWLAWLEKQRQRPNPYSGTSFEYNGHTWGICARDNGVEILIDGHIKGRVFTNDSNAKEMFIKALERVEEQNSKGYKLTDCDKNSWWEDFKTYTSCTIEQKLAWSEEDKNMLKWVIGYLENKMLNTPISEERTACKNAIAWLEEKLKGEQKPADKVEPKFKIGQIIKKDGFNTGFTIAKIEDDFYYNDKGDYFPFTDQDNWELVEQKPTWSEKAQSQLYWKPSEGQMEALKSSTYCQNKQMSKVLFELYQDLKKLREG